MRTGLIGAAATAIVLAGSPALAQPAPGSVCDFVQGAVIEAGDHFVHMKGDPGPEPNSWNMRQGFGPANATSCGISEGTPGKLIATCVWELKASEADAKSFLTTLNQQVGTCVGSGRKQFPTGDGGVSFEDSPTHMLALTGFGKNDDGTFMVLLTINEDGG